MHTLCRATQTHNGNSLPAHYAKYNRLCATASTHIHTHSLQRNDRMQRTLHDKRQQASPRAVITQPASSQSLAVDANVFVCFLVRYTFQLHLTIATARERACNNSTRLPRQKQPMNSQSCYMSGRFEELFAMILWDGCAQSAPSPRHTTTLCVLSTYLRTHNHARHTFSEGFRRVNERSVSDRRTRPALPQPGPFILLIHT